MPTNRITMRRIRETLRLHLQAGLSYNEVGRALKISKSVAGKYVSLARARGVDWELAQTLTDEELEARLYRPALPRSSHQLAPDYALVHQELKRPGVTLQLLWEEYARDNALAYKYTSFCIKYRAWTQSLSARCARSTSPARSCSSTTPARRCPSSTRRTGEISAAQIFVATLGASNYTYACATAAADHCRLDRRAGAGARVLRRRAAPDRARPDPRAHQEPDRYDPEPNRPYDEFAAPLRLRAAGRSPGAPARQAQSRELGARGRALDPGAAAQPPLLQPGRAQRAPSRSCWSS